MRRRRAARHRHVLDLRSTELQCVCQGCALLFEREAAGRGHYRLVPRDRLRLPEFAPAELGVPVGLAFFVLADDGAVVAHYPSPIGATERDVDADAWQGAGERCPALRDLQPGVQAFLVNTARVRASTGSCRSTTPPAGGADPAGVDGALGGRPGVARG